MELVLCCSLLMLVIPLDCSGTESRHLIPGEVSDCKSQTYLRQDTTLDQSWTEKRPPLTQVVDIKQGFPDSLEVSQRLWQDRQRIKDAYQQETDSPRRAVLEACAS